MLYRTCYTGHVLPILCLIRGAGVTGRWGMLSWHSSAILYISGSFVLFPHDIEGDSIVLQLM